VGCPPTDALSIEATDLAGNSYGPVVVHLNGGAGTGSVNDVIASIQAAVTGAGIASNQTARLTPAPKIIAVFAHGGYGGGVVIRNTAGGTLTLANVIGTPLDALGMAPVTYQPGGYSAGSQTVYLAEPNSIAPQGRGVFLGGSTGTDLSVWPHAPVEFRGNFLHGLRTDKAAFGDGNALLLGSGQAIGWGVGGPTLAVVAGALTATAPTVLPSLSLTHLPTSPVGLPTGTVWNNSGVLSIV
jgi:hypothetical protein